MCFQIWTLASSTSSISFVEVWPVDEHQVCRFTASLNFPNPDLDLSQLVATRCARCKKAKLLMINRQGISSRYQNSYFDLAVWYSIWWWLVLFWPASTQRKAKHFKSITLCIACFVFSRSIEAFIHILSHFLSIFSPVLHELPRIELRILSMIQNGALWGIEFLSLPQAKRYKISLLSLFLLL